MVPDRTGTASGRTTDGDDDGGPGPHENDDTNSRGGHHGDAPRKCGTKNSRNGSWMTIQWSFANPRRGGRSPKIGRRRLERLAHFRRHTELYKKKKTTTPGYNGSCNEHSLWRTGKNSFLRHAAMRWRSGRRRRCVAIAVLRCLPWSKHRRWAIAPSLRLRYSCSHCGRRAGDSGRRWCSPWPLWASTGGGGARGRCDRE